jgi:hypothetical protein
MLTMVGGKTEDRTNAKQCLNKLFYGRESEHRINVRKNSAGMQQSICLICWGFKHLKKNLRKTEKKRATWCSLQVF